ncbi:hypothetical protein [Enterococcus faecium]|uniref:DUF4760 domain-containing protein n=1 Tax=Enterococcus faecium TaxID=1352 RepID=A0A7V7KTT3_ENTFC|nr:hypothetical protein [Enterococcus faecium]KAA0691598.1 hypothetical protein DTX73_04600 [Enterococcus faecium]
MKKIKDYCRNWYDKNVGVILVWLLVILIFLTINILLLKIDNFQYLIKLCFWNNKEEMVNFTPITVIIAMLTFIYTRKKFKADLISKSRIEWLNTSKKISTDIIIETDKIASKVNTLIANYSNIEKMRDGEIAPFFEDIETSEKMIQQKNLELISEINTSRYILQKNINLFKMQFGPNAENDLLIERSENIWNIFLLVFEQISNFKINEKEDFEKFQENKIEPLFSEIENLIIGFSECCREYYKNEWNKAKKGK